MPKSVNFDILRKEQVKRWSKILAQDIEGIEKLILNDFKLFLFSIQWKRLNAEDILYGVFRKVMKMSNQIFFFYEDNSNRLTNKSNLERYLKK